MKTNKCTTEEFIKKAKLVHGDKYDYSLVDYVGSKLKVKIMCKKHGMFEQIPNGHLNGYKCLKCENKKVTTKEFIEKAKLVHSDKYNYSLVDYVGSKLKVKIMCKKHGIFEQTPNGHLNGNKCLKCENKNVTTEEFIRKAKLVHGDKYDYSLVDYSRNKLKVKIICEKHGIFEQTPREHLSKCGCGNCWKSVGELVIEYYLKSFSVVYIKQKKFRNCKNRFELPFDFYLPIQNLLIEFDGKQHYEPIKYFGGEKEFKLCQINDNIKNKFTEENNINLLRIKYTEINNIEKILNNII